MTPRDSEEYLQKKWEGLGISNDFIFGHVMQDEELCAEVEGAVAALVENGIYAEIAAKYPDIVNNLLFLSE